MPSLEQQLRDLKAKVQQKTPEDFTRITGGEVQKLIDSQSIEGLTTGFAAPDFILPDTQGNEVRLSEVLDKGPVVLSFYRGSW